MYPGTSSQSPRGSAEKTAESSERPNCGVLIVDGIESGNGPSSENVEASTPPEVPEDDCSRESGCLPTILDEVAELPPVPRAP